MAVLVAYAIVDDDMVALADEFWTLHSYGYAKTSRNGRRCYMHHAVLGEPSDGCEVSHGNAIKLDNRRQNLLMRRRPENALNTADPCRGSSGFRGVSRDRAVLAKPWRGKVTVKGRHYQTPRYGSAQEAADALALLRVMIGVGPNGTIRSGSIADQGLAGGAVPIPRLHITQTFLNYPRNGWPASA